MLAFTAFVPSLPKEYPFISLVPAMLFMSFWWFAPIQKKLTAFSSILWCLGYFNTQTFYVAITPIALSHALIWWYRHYQLDSTRGDLRDLKDNKGMKHIRILWTLADEQAHFPDSLNVYIQIDSNSCVSYGLLFLRWSSFPFGLSNTRCYNFRGKKHYFFIVECRQCRHRSQ